MPAILPETAPSDVGLDQARLDSIGRHFDRYVEDRKIPGFLAVVTRGGKVAYVVRGGFRDLENEAPVEADTRFRIYSMTKPVTSVAAMICYEEGLIALDDPLSKFIPEFGETRVFAGGSSAQPVTVPMLGPIKIWHLMTHTAGLTYGWMFNHPVDAIYRSAGFEVEPPADLDLAGCCGRLAQHSPALSAGHRMELLGGDGRSRPCRRGRDGACARRVLRRARVQAPRDEGDELLRRGRSRRETGRACTCPICSPVERRARPRWAKRP